MLNQNPDKPLNGTERYPMNHDWTMFLTICPNIFQIKPLRHLEIQLNRSTLPGSANRIYQMEVNLRSIESAVPLIDYIVQSQLAKSSTKPLGCHLPILVTAHTVFRTGRQLHMILETKQFIDGINQSGHSHNLFLNLFRHHKDVRVILSKTTHSHKAMQLSRFFMTMYQTQLTCPQRQIAIRTWF